MVISVLVVNGRAGVGGPVVVGGLLSLPVGLALHDELVCGGGEAVHGGLGQEWVGHHGQPLGRFPVGGHDGGGLAVPFHDQFVEVGGLDGGSDGSVTVRACSSSTN